MTSAPEAFLIDDARVDATSHEKSSSHRQTGHRRNVALGIGILAIGAIVITIVFWPHRNVGQRQEDGSPSDDSGWEDSSVFTDEHKTVLGKTLSRLDSLLGNSEANQNYILVGVQGREQIPAKFPGTPLFAIGGAQHVHELYPFTRIQDSHFRYINLLVLIYLQELESREASTCTGLRQFFERMFPNEQVKELPGLNQFLADKKVGLKFGSEAHLEQSRKSKSDVIKSKMLAGRDLNKVSKPFKAIVAKFGTFHDYFEFYKFYMLVLLRDITSLSPAGESSLEKVQQLEAAVSHCYNMEDGVVLLYPASDNGLPEYTQTEQKVQVKQRDGKLFHPVRTDKILEHSGSTIDIDGKSYVDPRKFHFLIHYVPTLWANAWQAQEHDSVLVDGGGPSSAIPLLFKLLHDTQEELACRFDRAGFVYPTRSGQDLHADELLSANNVPVAQEALRECSPQENRSALEQAICQDIFERYVRAYEADFDNINKLKKVVVYGGGRAAGEVARRRVEHNRKLGIQQVLFTVWHRCDAKIDYTMRDWQDMLAEITKDSSILPYLDESARVCLEQLRKQVQKVVGFPKHE